jgi:glucose dehydrogenase
VADSFENAPNADLTKDSFVNKLDKEIKSVLAESNQQIPIVIDGNEIYDRTQIDGYDPSDNAKVWYQYAVARKSDVDSAVRIAKKAVADCTPCP